MSNTILPLKSILEGDHRSLVQALRDVAHQDDAITLHKKPVALQSLRERIVSCPLKTLPTLDLKTKSLLEHFFFSSEQGMTIYQTEAPAALFFADKIVTALYLANRAHGDIEVPLAQLGLLLVTALAQRNEAITDSEHPLRAFSEAVFLQASIWENANGKPGKQFPDFLRSLLNDFASLDVQSNDTWQRLTHEIQGFQRANETRSRNLEKRLRDTLEIDPEQQKQQQVVSRWINRKLNGKPLPDDIALFIRQHLIGDIQHHLIHSGDESLWSLWQKLLHVLSWIFKESNDPDYNTKVRNVLIPIAEDLDERYYEGLNDSEKYQNFIALLTDLLIQRLQGKGVKCSVFRGQEFEETSVVVKQAVIQNHNSFSEGQWFLFYRNDETTLRAKLLLKSVKTDTLIFANFLGKKAYESDFENFSLQLAAHSAVAINRDQVFKRALYQALKALELHHRRNLALKQEAENIREARRSQAAEKARHEAEIIAQRQAEERLEEQRHIQQRSELQPEALEVYENTLKDLQVGAWVAITDKTGISTNAKLSVKLASTNRYVFTDRLGQPVGDHNLDDLIDLMIDKRLEILNSGDNFENKLEQIVKGLRRA